MHLNKGATYKNYDKLDFTGKDNIFKIADYCKNMYTSMSNIYNSKE